MVRCRALLLATEGSVASKSALIGALHGSVAATLHHVALEWAAKVFGKQDPLCPSLLRRTAT